MVFQIANCPACILLGLFPKKSIMCCLSAFAFLASGLSSTKNGKKTKQIIATLLFEFSTWK